MDKEMFYFYRNALARNLCSEYSSEFKHDIEDKQKLLSLSLRQQSIPYFCTAVYQKWGLDVEYIKNAFKKYINGKYTARSCDNVNGYTYPYTSLSYSTMPSCLPFTMHVYLFCTNPPIEISTFYAR